MITVEKKAKIIKSAQTSATDTGSSPVQIALLTEKINELAAHLKKHKKDLHSRRGLLNMVASRRKHLKYLEKKSKDVYEAIVKKLKLKA